MSTLPLMSQLGETSKSASGAADSMKATRTQPEGRMHARPGGQGGQGGAPSVSEYTCRLRKTWPVLPPSLTRSCANLRNEALTHRAIPPLAFRRRRASWRPPARRLCAQVGTCRQITVAAPKSRRAVRVGGHREVENRAPRPVGGHPQPTAMRFDDRTADRQPHSQTLGLCRVERIKEAFETRRSQAWPRILHRNQHAIRFGRSGGDEQLSLPFRDRAHGLDRVDDEIEDDLLQLNAIPFDGRQTLPECRLHRRAIFGHFPTSEFDHLADCLVQIHSVLS